MAHFDTVISGTPRRRLCPCTRSEACPTPTTNPMPPFYTGTVRPSLRDLGQQRGLPLEAGQVDPARLDPQVTSDDEDDDIRR